ncbi:50S ribosomal protein L20 [Chitinivibrio alkaliphilus]|uniref:Large ribosomal subunit protein bL20 n=1 Tax=Chitinivibrio alkaliphilus ACht1 TaxID=1313304 RepID=U7D8L0_9BACT|nr:50S ribosomal protein L20 [Chitinivibrio alkaliphilus]ERP31896.1 ribosomal protein L20 [Chitinivibrio alkaliphilus ACht1]
MPRAKNRVASRAKRKKVLSANKGYFGKRKNCIRTAKDAFYKAGEYAYRDRRQNKRNFRRLWITRINAAARLNGLTYSELMCGLKEKGIDLNRKALAHMAVNEPDAFAEIVNSVK